MHQALMDFLSLFSNGWGVLAILTLVAGFVLVFMTKTGQGGSTTGGILILVAAGISVYLVYTNDKPSGPTTTTTSPAVTLPAAPTLAKLADGSVSITPAPPAGQRVAFQVDGVQKNALGPGVATIPAADVAGGTSVKVWFCSEVDPFGPTTLPTDLAL